MLTVLGIGVKDERGVGAWVLGVCGGVVLTVLLASAALDIEPEHLVEAIRWELAERAAQNERARQIIEQ